MADATQRVIDLYGGAVTLVPGGVQVRDQGKLRSPATDRLVWQAVFETGDDREAARWLLWELGQVTGARPASINDLYLARGRGECGGFTVPAINVRMLAYDTARAIFRAARAGKAGRHHPGDCAIGDRVHGAASVRVCLRTDRGSTARGLYPAALHSGRPLSGQSQEISGRSRLPRSVR